MNWTIGTYSKANMVTQTTIIDLPSFDEFGGKDCHQFIWTPVKDGGIAQCQVCHVITTKLNREDCFDYIPKETILAERKERRDKEREIKRQATIEYLKKSGKLN